MGPLTSAVALLLVLVMFAICLVSRARSLLSARRGSVAHRGAAHRGSVRLIAAAAVAATPWVAIPIAEASTGWVDNDHNGYRDPLGNGAYDWADLVAPTWSLVVVVLLAAILGCLVLGPRVVGGNSAKLPGGSLTAQAQQGPRT